MTVWDFITRNQNVILALLGIIASVTGLKEWARRVDAQWSMVRDWSMVAADATIAASHNGLLPINADLVNEWRTRLLEYAQALGFNVPSKLMMRALAHVQKKLTETAVRNQFDRVSTEAAELIRARMINGAVEPIKARKKSANNPGPTMLLLGIITIVIACSAPSRPDPVETLIQPDPSILIWDDVTNCWSYGPVNLPNPTANDGSRWDVTWKACPVIPFEKGLPDASEGTML